MDNNQTTTNTLTSSQVPDSRSIRPSDIMSNMVPGESPLDFIKKNIEPAALQSTVPPVVAAPVVPPVEAPQISNPPPAGDPLPKFDDEPEVPPAAEEPVDPDEEGLEPTPEVIQKEHYQNLRAKTKEAKKAARELEAKFKEAESELTKYKTGEIVPDLLREQNDKIERLSRFEKLINVKTSEEYIEQVAAPLNDKVSKLKDVFRSYRIDESQLDAALDHFLADRPEAEQNAALLEHFDVLGAQKVSGMLEDIRGLKSKEAELESEPTRVFEQLQAESQARKTTEEIQRTTRIKEVAQDGWVEALLDIRNDGKIKELIRSESDPAFNQKFVDPILNKSAQEYGSLIKEFAKNGVKEISKDLSKSLANMVLRAVTHSLAFEARDVALTRLNEIESVADRANMLLRPNIGGGTARSSAPMAPAEQFTPEQAAKHLSNSILRPR